MLNKLIETFTHLNLGLDVPPTEPIEIVKHEPIIVTCDPFVITIPHLGITLRSMMSVAVPRAQEYAQMEGKHDAWRPRFDIRYKNTVIGELRLKSFARRG